MKKLWLKLRTLNPQFHLLCRNYSPMRMFLAHILFCGLLGCSRTTPYSLTYNCSSCCCRSCNALTGSINQEAMLLGSCCYWTIHRFIRWSYYCQLNPEIWTIILLLFQYNPFITNITFTQMLSNLQNISCLLKPVNPQSATLDQNKKYIQNLSLHIYLSILNKIYNGTDEMS